MEDKLDTEKVLVKPKKIKSVAKKDFVICQNEFLRKIKKGDDLSDIPKVYVQNLETEGVL